jgi:cyclic pyranopterin phosphate synthase
LRTLLRGGATDEQIAAAVGPVWRDREDRYSELRGANGAPEGERRVEMHYIGG